VAGCGPAVAAAAQPGAALLIAWLLVTATRFYAAAWDVQLGYHVVHFSGMILGAALVFLPRLPGWTAWLGLWVLVMLVVGSDPGRYFANTSFGVMAAEIGTAMMLPALTGESALARLFSWRPLVAVGTISYGIYIWHFPIQRVIWEQPWAIDTAVTLGGALVCAALSYRFIERSGSRQKRAAAEFAAQPAAGST
jgi:peptidoglycan/LPS O-acetylase OafA/YrhL